MAQLVARLVRNEKVGGSNPPSSTTGRHPIRMSVFCMPGHVGAVPGAVLLVAPMVFRAPSGPAAREARRPHFVRRRASKPSRAPPPPTGTAAVPSEPSGALHTGGAWSLMCGSARRFVVRPGLATARWHRGCALRTLRRPPHRRRLVADVWLGASFRCPARPRHRPLAPRLATHVKPSSPLLACAPSPVKPMTPLQARYTCFRRNFGEQRRHGFHGDVPVSPHWCRRFHLAAR